MKTSDMELWTKLLSLIVLQIVAAQEDYYPDEYLPTPENYGASLPQAYYPPPSPVYLPPSPFIPSQYSPPCIPEYTPSLPVEPDYQPALVEEEVISIPALPEINLSQPPPVESEENCDIPPSYPVDYLPPISPFSSYSAPPSYGYCPPLEVPKYKLKEKCGKIFKKNPCATLKEKLLAKKVKLINKMVGLLYKPSLLDKKCSLCKKYECECSPYEKEYYPSPYLGY